MPTQEEQFLAAAEHYTSAFFPFSQDEELNAMDLVSLFKSSEVIKRYITAQHLLPNFHNYKLLASSPFLRESQKKKLKSPRQWAEEIMRKVIPGELAGICMAYVHLWILYLHGDRTPADFQAAARKQAAFTKALELQFEYTTKLDKVRAPTQVSSVSDSARYSLVAETYQIKPGLDFLKEYDIEPRDVSNTLSDPDGALRFVTKDLVFFVNGLLNLRRAYFVIHVPQHAIGLSIDKDKQRIIFFDPNFGQVVFDKDSSREGLIQFLVKYGKLTDYESFRYVLLTM